MMVSAGGRSAERSAACSTCGKTFARSDTLLRHEKNHHSTDARGPVHRVTDGTFRACGACATARSRCSGGSPCGRCNVRQIECVYPNKRRKAQLPSDSAVSTNDDPGQQQLVGRFSEIVFAADAPFQLPTEAHVNGSSSAVNSGPSQPQLILQHTLSSDNVPGQHLGLPSGEGILHPRTMSTPTQIPQNDHFGYNTILSAHNSDFVGPKTTFDYSTFDEPLNWIPPSIYPSPYDAELEQDFSFILPTLSHTPTFETDYGLAMQVDASNTNTYHVPTHQQHNVLNKEGLVPSFAHFGQSPASSASDGAHQNMSVNSASTTSDLRRKKRKPSLISDDFAHPRRKDAVYMFPTPVDFSNFPVSEIAPEYCTARTYGLLSQQFQTLCLECSTTTCFERPSFPPVSVINTCIALYFENFQANLPVIHQASFGPESHWLLFVAVATIGSNFTKAPYSSDLREAFQEFLRRAVDHSAAGLPDAAIALPLAQARILNLVGLMQSDRELLRAYVPRYHTDLSLWCLESGVFQITATDASLVSQADEDNDNLGMSRWHSWIATESLCRVAYLSWMLDCAVGYMANARPLCNMDDARTPLPCLESAWNATTPEVWANVMQDLPKTSSLCAVLEQLYTTKKVDPSYSELSQLLIIHALYQRTWEVGTHIKQPLSEWVPTGKARGFLNTPSKDNFWLPLYPLYANWRNSACDCLDVIHWQASSVVAKASGVEHPLVLELHLARIVLLTPFQEIQDLLFSLIGKVGNSPKASYYVHDGSYQPRNSAKLPQIRKITWRWLREDQHKARLAMVHAGSVFWYVRRYSAMSFFEPLAVYLASLVLWTYGSYKSAALERDAAAANQRPEGGPSGPDAHEPVQPSRMERKEHPVTFMSKASAPSNTSSAPISVHAPAPPRRKPDATSAEQDDTEAPPSPSAQDPESESDDGASSSDEQPEFIHLDRPCDDEMVQHFVRNGHNMSGHMTNVGDICKSPHKVLLEGAKLLRTRLTCWGVSREYYDTLMKLAELRKAT